MADDVVGGLEQASPYEKAQAKYQEQITRLSKIQDDLMASLDTRQGAGNPLLALASGFLAPTRGGGFGESAGNALQSMGAQQQLEQKQSQDNAMMRMQLAQQSLTPYKEQMELARRSSMSGDLKKLLGAGGQTIQGPEAANMARSVGVAPFSNEAASLIGRPSPTASGGNNVFGNIDATTRGLLMSQAGVDPEGVMKELATFGMKESGRTDKMKEMEYFAKQFPGADRAKLMQVAAARSLLGDPATLITAIKSVQEMIDQEQDIPTNKAIKGFLLSQLGMYGYGSPAGAAQGSGQPATPQFGGTPPAIPQIGATQPSSSAARPPIPAATIPAAPATDTDIIRNAPANTRSGQIPRGASLEDAASVLNQSIADPELRRVLLEDYRKGVTTSPMSAVQPTIMKVADTGESLNKAQRELRNRQMQEVQTARNKTADEERKKVYVNFNQASQDRLASADVTTLVTQSPNMFGVFERPDFGSAIGGIVENAVNIGRFNIGMPGIRAAVSKLGARNQQDIDNMQKVAAVAVNSSLSLAAAAKGSVSNFERELFQQASLSTHDTPNVLLYKADLLKARANFYTVMWDDFRSFEKKNPSANFSDYQDTAGKQLLSRYEAQLAKIRDNYTR
tara:strand:+ start:10157 stop:12022 length:1866 start_codon:yes stop_codon:yes gene_type:complete